LDNLINKIAVLRAAVSRYVEAAREFIASTNGKVILAAVLLVAVAAYAHHHDSAGKAELKAQVVAALQKQLATVECPTVTVREPIEDTESKQRAAELADRLSESEAAKARLQKKVSDYEKQLARKPAKAGSFVLSPADARGLSNVK
jgi:capsule polysaccharide export protein KpsE/RkpR